MTATAVPGPAVTRRKSKRLEVAMLVAALLPLLSLDNVADLNPSVRFRGAVLWIASLLPALWYTTRLAERREPVPFFPLIGLVYGVYYALPPILGQVNLAYRPDQFRIAWLDPARDFDFAIDLALGGWIALLLGYFAIVVFVAPRRSTDRPWPARPLARLVAPFVAAGIFADSLSATVSLPTVISGAIGFVGILSRFGIAILLVLNVRRLLTPRQRMTLFAAIPLEVMALLATGSVAKVFLFVLFLLLTFWMVGGRIPVRWLVAGVVGAALLIVVKGVLYDYRRAAWFSGAELGIVERTGLMMLLAKQQVEEHGLVGAVAVGMQAAASRSAVLDILADATRRTPRDIPYWNGATYRSLVGFAIPRFLWPGKPQKRVGQDFGHRYAYIDPRDRFTSVNLPFLVEFYINFGAIGVYVGMFLTGVLMRIFDLALNQPGQSIIRSLVAMSILIPLLNIESDFSLVFGGVFLNALAFTLVLRVLRMKVDAAIVPRGSPTGVPVRTQPGSA